VRFPFDPEQSLVIVPVRLWGPEGNVVARFALDTGATGTVVNWDVVVLLGYDPAIAPERIQMITGSGVEFVPRINVERIEALGQTRRDFPIHCHTLPPSGTVDGLLGVDFFKGQRLVVDFRTDTIIIE